MNVKLFGNMLWCIVLTPRQQGDSSKVTAAGWQQVQQRRDEHDIGTGIGKIFERDIGT